MNQRWPAVIVAALAVAGSFLIQDTSKAQARGDSSKQRAKIDSAQAVKLAMKALDPKKAVRYEVWKFLRLEDGFQVSLLIDVKAYPQYVVRGGGGTVKVYLNGRTRVLRRGM